MKKILLSAVAICAVSTAAFAADLPSRRAPPVYIPPAIPTFTWTGGYLGINAGYAFDGYHTFTTTGNTAATAALLAAGTRPGSFTDRSSGFTGGGQIGYNYEFMTGPGAGVVVGVEADASYAGSGSGGVYSAGGLATTFTSRTDYVGTVRGRLGYAFDRLLVYGTGGFAYGNVHDSERLYTAGVNTFTGLRNTMRTGYAYGGGVEYAIPTDSFLNVLSFTNLFKSSAVTIKAEFVHYDLGTSSVLVGSNTGSANSYTASIRTQGNLVRAGLNYKLDFTPTPAPVVARY